MTPSSRRTKDTPVKSGDAPGTDVAVRSKAKGGVPATRGKRKRLLRDIAEEKLYGNARFLVSDPMRARVQATLSGPFVLSDRADMDSLGDSIKRIGHLFMTLTESRPQLFDVAWGNSVTLEIGAPDDEIERAAKALAEVDAVDETEITSRMFQAAVPETLLAAFATQDLLVISEEDVVSAALQYGKAVTDAFKGLVRTLADDEMSLALTLPLSPDEHETIELSSTDARVYKEALMTVGSEETVKVRAVGVLTMADSSARQVRLTLDKSARNDQALRKRRVITAKYTVAAGRKIRDLNLWDHSVRVQFEMTRARAGTATTVRPPTFVLVDAEPRHNQQRSK
jgi:hypothetical protein